MSRYIIVECGVYNHRMFGLYNTLKAAQDAAKELAKNDEDDYHNWEVHRLECGEWVDTGTCYNKRNFK
jgi:hypothetical protein